MTYLNLLSTLGSNNYGAHVVESHHIYYFVTSLNNDVSNQLFVCPNYHSIIYELNLFFDRRTLIYLYRNDIQD